MSLQIRGCRDNRASMQNTAPKDRSSDARQRKALYGRGIAVLVLLATGSAVPAQTLRPLETETAVVLPSGTMQIALGTTYLRNRRFPAFTDPGFLESQNLVSAPEIEMRVGAGDWVEIQLRYQFLYLDEQRSNGESFDKYGSGDAEIFTKVRFLREREWLPALGARFGVKLPNANRDDRLGTDETDFDIAVLATKTFGPITAHVNLGLQILGNPGELAGDETGSASGQDDPITFSLGAVTKPLCSELLGPYELRGMFAFDWKTASRFANDFTRVGGGFQVTRSAWTVYTGATGGLGGAAEDYGLRLGVIYALELERLRGLFD